MSRNTDDGRRLQRVPRGLLLVAALAGFLGCFGVVTAIASLSANDNEAEHEGGPVTQRVAVASGETPGDLGRWKIWRSEDADGTECLEVQLLDAPVAPPEGRSPAGIPVPGGGILGGGCGPGDFNVGSVNGVAETLIFGPVPAGTARVEVSASGGGPKGATPRGAAGAPGKYFGVAVNGRHSNIEARALASSGSELKSKAVPVP